jgi:uncharacterized protein
LPNTSTIAHLLLDIARVMVDRAEFVTIRVLESEREINYVLSVPAEEMGKLIGKQGRTARAIRIILNEMRRVDKRTFSLDVQRIEAD